MHEQELITYYFMCSDQHVRYWMSRGLSMTSSLLLDYQVKQYIHTLVFGFKALCEKQGIIDMNDIIPWWKVLTSLRSCLFMEVLNWAIKNWVHPRTDNSLNASMG